MHPFLATKTGYIERVGREMCCRGKNNSLTPCVKAVWLKVRIPLQAKVRIANIDAK